MPLIATRGAASAQGFGEFAQATAANYIEDVFSAFLFTGTGSNQTITNNIDLSTKGGLVWTKCRSTVQNNSLVDTVRGGDVTLVSETTAANDYGSGQGAQSFTSTGYVTGGFSARTYVSWTFREQPKFFDIVTYTGNATNRTIAHNLGSVPGCIIVKSTTSVSNWYVYHRSLATNQALKLNSTAAIETAATLWNNTAATSTEFSVGTAGDTNGNGQTFVAYIFAHDAGGFGLTGTDNVISCGSFTTDGSGVITSPVNLGYEPQWILSKRADSTGNWRLIDSMRGNPVADGTQQYLYANLNDAESPSYGEPSPTSTGFTVTASTANSTYIYIAIRRGPMEVPTLGTSVFAPLLTTGTSTARNLTGTNSPVDLLMSFRRNQGGSTVFLDRLRGMKFSDTASSSAESSSGDALTGFDVMSGVALGIDSNYAITNRASPSCDYVFECFSRAPGFFDEVCYTGTGGASNTITHNLGVVPEMIILKKRSGSSDWPVYHTGVPTPLVNNPILNGTAASYANSYITPTPTTTQFVVNAFNDNTGTYVAYLFATCAGVSKVGSYTGNGTTQTINCGFGAGGVRFVIIKRTDSTGGWYTYDTARGMTVLTDPYLFLNSTAAEVATLGSVTTVSTGFALDSAILAAINVNAGTYIFLAIA